MKDFVASKMISLAIPLALIGFGAAFWQGADTKYWWFLIIVTMVLGYAHAVIGFAYQARAFRRSEHKGRLFSVLAALSVISVLICLWFIAHDMVGAFIMFVFAYFILHGFLNEKTLLSMQTGIQLPTIYFLVLTLLSTAIIYGSLMHPSFFFDGPLQFYPMPEEARLWSIEQNLGADPQYIAYGLFMAALGLFAFSLRALREYRGVAYATAAAFVVALGSLFALYPLNYVFLFHLFLSYHFIVWSVVFYQKFRAHHPERVGSYVRHHLYVLVPLLLLLALFLLARQGIFEEIGAVVFDARTFLTVSFLHITLSFMNESWFKGLLRLQG